PSPSRLPSRSFFVQAEDGIRDFHVTGVQTCALPIWPQKALHAMNPVRLAYVTGRTTLRDARVLDVGCGGGLLSEALAGEGAVVTAIDLSPELLKVARLHGLETGVSADYRQQPEIGRAHL